MPKSSKETRSRPKYPPIKGAYLSKSASSKIPIPPSVLLESSGFQKRAPPWPAQNNFPGQFPTLPTPVFPAYSGFPSLALHPPAQLRPLASLVCHKLPGLVWIQGGIHWEGGTVRALPWQPCLCCLCLMFLCLSCA